MCRGNLPDTGVISLTGRSPHQSEDWFAMTVIFDTDCKESIVYERINYELPGI